MKEQEMPEYPDEYEEPLSESPNRNVTSEPMRQVQRRQRPQPRVEEKKVAEPRFIAYHRPESHGVGDSITNVSMGEDVFTILAEVLNRLDRISKVVGAE